MIGALHAGMAHLHPHKCHGHTRQALDRAVGHAIETGKSVFVDAPVAHLPLMLAAMPEVVLPEVTVAPVVETVPVVELAPAIVEIAPVVVAAVEISAPEIVEAPAEMVWAPIEVESAPVLEAPPMVELALERLGVSAVDVPPTVEELSESLQIVSDGIAEIENDRAERAEKQEEPEIEPKAKPTLWARIMPYAIGLGGAGVLAEIANHLFHFVR